MVCSSDDEYAEIIPQLYERINGRAEIIVAGNPASGEDLKKIGIRYFINVQSDLIETIEQFHKLAGIE